MAAEALANRVSDQDLAEGRLYPPLDTIRDCSTAIAAYIADHAYKNGKGISFVTNVKSYF